MPVIPLPLRGLAHDCDGAVVAEFVIILLPLLLLLFGTLDVGLAVLAKTRISFAVEAAAKCGALNMAVCGSASAIAAYGASGSAAPSIWPCVARHPRSPLTGPPPRDCRASTRRGSPLRRSHVGST